MADVTIKRFDELESYKGEGRFCYAGKTLGVGAWGMNVLRLPAGWSDYPDHDHAADGQEEVYVVLEGSATMQAGSEKFTLEPGMLAKVGPAQKRKIVPGPKGVTLIALGGTPGESLRGEIVAVRHALLALWLLIGAGVAAASEPARRPLSFEDRVRAQKAIEQVYWKHRLWPKENPDPKPPLSAVMPDEVIRHKVSDYLRKSNALSTFWEHPINGEQLQAEIDRMVKDSRDPNALRDLFAALGNDPVLIAETLARQTLADRLVRNWFAYDDRLHGALRSRIDSELASCDDVSCLRSMSGDYHEARWRHDDARDDRAMRLSADEWRTFRKRRGALPLGKPGRLEDDAESFSVSATVSMTDEEISTVTVVWPKVSFETWWRSAAGSLDASIVPAAGRFAITEPRGAACTVDTWRATDALIEGRYLHTAVWTGSEMIVWGGYHGLHLNSGGRYTPATDSWVPTSMGAGLPAARALHTAVWSGSRMILWGARPGPGLRSIPVRVTTRPAIPGSRRPLEPTLPSRASITPRFGRGAG